MAHCNSFLLDGPSHNRLLHGCFCTDCRMLRSEELRNISTRDIFNRFNKSLPAVENEQLMKVHETILKMIVHGKCYQERCLRNTRYKQWKSWANMQPEFQPPYWSPLALKKLAENINNATFVFEQWDTITRNLTDPRIDILDARRFSLRQFRKAADIGWCLLENETKRPVSGTADDLYDNGKYQALLNHIKTSGILHDFNHDNHIAAMLMKKLSRDVVKHCKNITG